MARINLLPWRAERRKQREREFFMMLGATAAAAAVVLFAAIFWMGQLVDGQSARNAYLQGEIKSLEKKIEEIKELDKTRSQLLTRKEIIEQLQSNRSQMVHLFDELVKTIPDGVRLGTMKQVGDRLTLEGFAESNSRVATYMRNINASPWMGQTDLRKTENKIDAKDVNKKLPYVFSLDVKLRKPDEVGKESSESTAASSLGDTASASPAEQKKPADLGAQLDAAATKLMGDKKAEDASKQVSSSSQAAGDKK